ncbi:hypothetical protein NJB1507_46240 [Mycobacterium marinum]|uniref:RNA-directed DNA polymerase n=1 Tax=Mycobacterium marinum TaxID=1781 RepID=UPI0021C33473|nr:RNA-directed DNA polymerase [Mycobacterium marinum]GJO33949.1 hypothetical protein NJB1507_46240 [Mycobacterium marinum]
MSRSRLHRYNVYPGIVDQLDLAVSMTQAKRNDLLPARPDDKAGGQVGERFIGALKHSLTVGDYEPERAVIVPVVKPRYSTRPAALLNLADRVVYHAMVEPLRLRIEKGLVSDRVLFWPRAKQSEKRWGDFELAPLVPEGTHIVKADVSGFYESIDHRLLHQVLLTLTGKIDLIDALMDFLGQVMAAHRGVPQGLDTSDVLATAYLSNVDSEMLRLVHHFWRHGDDIRITVKDHDEGRRAVHYLEQQLRSRQLLLNSEKTLVLHRETYQQRLTAVEHRRAEVRRRLVDERESRVANGTLEGLDELVERVGEAIELRWLGFYEPEIDLDHLAAQLRPHLEPGEVEVAATAFEEAVENAPGSQTDGALTDEEFHGVFMSSLTTLLTDKNPLPITSAPKVIGLFPDKTRILSEYLRAVASSYPNEVSNVVTEVLTSGYLTGLQKTWLLIALREVVASGGVANLTFASEIANSIAEDEGESWLARVEAVRLLAHLDCLDRDLLTRVWDRAPAPLRADLVAAVAIVARDPNAAWAIAFRDSLNPDALMQVVLHGVDNARVPSIAKTTGVAGAQTGEVESR